MAGGEQAGQQGGFLGPSPTGVPGGSVVNSVSTTDPWLDVAPTTGNVIASQRVAANWPIANVRWYAVDVVNGNDANVGFSDVSSADAGTKAKKTMAALAAIIPQIGDGRFIVIVVAQGTYATGLTFLNATGYNQPLIVCTGTNATAGAVAFAGNAADLSYAGAVTAPGMNAAGYNPTVAATTTSIPCTKVGGGAPGFTVDGATSTLAGFRVRFDINTTTAALRNHVETIQIVPGVDTIGLCVALPAAPAATDVFYIEAPGLVVPRVAALLSAFSRNGWSVVGADFLLPSQFSTGGSFYPTFCRFRGNFTMQGGLMFSQANVTHPTVVGAVAGGCRFEGFHTCISTNFTMDRSYVSSLVLQFCTNTQLDLGSCLGNLTIVGRTTGANTFAKIGQNIAAQGQPVRILGVNSTGTGPLTGIYAQDAQIDFGGILFGGQGAHPAISLVGSCNISFVGQGAVIGNEGSDVGLDLTAAQSSTIGLIVQPTVTGTAGDVRLANGTLTSWSALFATGIIDHQANRFVSVSAPLATVKSFSTVIITSAGGATHGFMTDVGISAVAIIGNEPVAIQYPTSARLITRLRGGAPSGTGAQPPTFTLYKNGVATAMTVTLPTGAPAGTNAVDSAHPILFADGDTFDVRVDFGATSEGNQPVCATLEGPC